MKNESSIKTLLVDNAIRLIAEGGFEKATTKELTHCGGDLPAQKMNEAYIYRLFGSKENLYAEAFCRLEQEIFLAFRDIVSSVGALDVDTVQKLYAFFNNAWEFVLKNESHFRCYVRYYYSIYFKGETLKQHQQDFNFIVDSFRPLFKSEADVVAIMQSVFNALLGFAVRIYNGELENNEVNRLHIFNVLYCIMMTYFKDETLIKPQIFAFL